MTKTRLRGVCRALYCFDIGWSIDLDSAAEMLTNSRRTDFQHKGRAPLEGGLSRPLRCSWTAGATSLGEHALEEEAEISVYDLGALCITWSLPFEGELEELVEISALLYDNAELTARSRGLVEEIARTLGSSVSRPRLAPRFEDYAVFQARPNLPDDARLLQEVRESLAQILRAEEKRLSTQEVDDALANSISYGLNDVCLIDWLAAFLLGEDTEDERLVLELATVELLELRILDAQLDRVTQEAYELLARPRGPLSVLTHQRSELEHVGRIQADDALLHEGIDNALKLFGDDYLARLYRMAAARFHFDDWDTSIQRKLGVLRSIYQSLADSAAHRRSELLEWIIILLIAMEIVLGLVKLV